MRNDTKVIANVRVGRPDVAPTAPSHIRGVFQGNKHQWLQRPKGIDDHGDHATATARRSTAIRAEDHDVIDPRMPSLSPS